jgi:ADP-ribosyl-[dinitrogen reductase] hydrolase
MNTELFLKKRCEVMLDKIKGGLFGVAIGDALGGTTEFMSESEIKKQYGSVTDIIGGGVWGLSPGEVTDDTAMTMAVAKGILVNPSDPIPSIGDEFLKWFQSNPKDVGIIISNVLRQFNGDWFQTAELVHLQLNKKSAGNGSLMRCLPVALAYDSLAQVHKITTAQSKITHFDDLATEACLIYNSIAYKLLHNKPIKKAIEEEIKGTRYESMLFEQPQVPADGFVVNTFLWVLYYLYNIEEFREIVIAAANKGGDSDTIAAIACGLKGVEVGYEKLPSEYKDKILLKKELAELAQRLFECRTQFSN